MEVKVKIGGLELEDFLDEMRDYYMARKAYDRWKANKGQIVEEMEKAYDGSIPKETDVQRALFYAAGYRDGLKEKELVK